MAFPSSQIPFPASTPTRWDVFLSFRGVDTRFKFTSHLYAALDRHGIRTFKDDPEIRTREVISDALVQAIQESKTYIVVFSENYASSPWCLDELIEIYNCHKTMKRSIITVFYNIDPSVVRHQTESFNEAFGMHEVQFAGKMEKVNNWRLTLTKVAGLCGKHISANRFEADIINEIVDEILLEIKPKTLDVAKYPVGLDSRVRELRTLFSSGTEGVIKIGIYGMGGVGKTTLAKALYNQLLLESFKGSCFLANIREVSGTPKGLESLQQQLINDVLKSKNNVEVHNVDEGIQLIRHRICATKILVVVDDLDHHTQYESLVGPFASGSLVIVTTRNEDVLDTIEVEPGYRYMVNELNDVESLALFIQHAFGNTKPNNNLMVLSRDIICHAGGLPLALEVFGSYLFKRSEVGWKSFILKLQRDPNSSVQQRLVTSLDAIECDDPMLKKIFLDIACFFVGWKKEEVVTILETYYSYADHNIDILKKRCLLTINKKDELGMHDLLRDMGREIACNNSPDDPGKYSRLWKYKDICDVLKKHKGTKAIEGIINQYFWPIHASFGSEDAFDESIATETFKGMSKLRFLHLKGVYLTGNFEQTLENLRWLRWDFCPLNCLPSGFCPQKLVSLELTYSELRIMWELNMVPQVFYKLKTLNLSNSVHLTKTPDFTKLPCLETLNLKGCRSLEEVHISIGSLVKLVSLELFHCVKLRSLPDSICNLCTLKNLDIGYCRSLEALPIELGNIRFLTELNANRLTVSKFPDSVGDLINLIKLRINNSTNLRTLPDTICNLRALKELNLDDCSSLEALPSELGNIECLTVLRASTLNVSSLPDSIGRLSKLVELRLSSNKNLRTLPDSICILKALRVLDIDYCSSLEALPLNLGNIGSLTKLSALGLTVSKLPDSIGMLSNLVELRLSANENLETLPNTIGSLRSLEILLIGNLVKLKELPYQLWNITSLRKLLADGASLLKKLPDIESGKDVSSLKWLDVRKNVLLTTLPLGISQLSNLEDLDLENCHNLLSIKELPLTLKVLRAKGCKSMERLTNISNLKQLEVLDLTDCIGLTEIHGLEELPSIKILHLGGCNSSLLLHTLTEHFFQIYSEFGHEIRIHTSPQGFPDWINKSSMSGSKVSLDLLPNVSHSFLGIILCFYNGLSWDFGSPTIHYLVESLKSTTTNDYMLGRTIYDIHKAPVIVIVPRSIFSVKDGDDRIGLTTSQKMSGIHLLYKPEITMVDTYSTTTNVDVRRSYHSN